jgi:hypothetical protein
LRPRLSARSTLALVGVLIVALALTFVWLAARRTGPDSRLSSNTSAIPAHEDIEIADTGFTQLPPDPGGHSYFTYAAVVANPNAVVAAGQVSLTISFLDGFGSVQRVERPVPFVLLPGQQQAVASSSDGTGISSMRVQVHVGSWLWSAPSGRFVFAGTATAKDPLGLAHTTATMTSSFVSEQKFVQVTAVYYGPLGNIMGGATTFVEYVRPGGVSQVQVNAFTTPPEITRTELFAAIST